MAFSEQLKLRIRRMAHFQCCLCHSLGVEIHHVVPQAEGGLDSEDNAAPLCPSCHEIYGANPVKRKFVKEARDFWYEVCEKRYASDKDQLDRLVSLIENTIKRDELAEVLDQGVREVLRRLGPTADEWQITERSGVEILSAIEELFDKVWYDRHQSLRHRVLEEGQQIAPSIWEGALVSAKRVEEKYGEDALGPWSDFDWGMINGKLSALRWALGDEWDNLDT